MWNSAEVIPLVQAWNQIYASRSAHSPHHTAPCVETYDFERLYTNTDTGGMQSNIMQLIQEVFDLEDHRNHAGIKVFAKKAAQWLKPSEMPASNTDRYSNNGGGSFTFDIHTIQVMADVSAAQHVCHIWGSSETADSR